VILPKTFEITVHKTDSIPCGKKVEGAIRDLGPNPGRRAMRSPPTPSCANPKTLRDVRVHFLFKTTYFFSVKELLKDKYGKPESRNPLLLGLLQRQQSWLTP
jgi:hypothetical protein